MSRVVNIVGAGNALMGDDGVGVEAVSRLAKLDLDENIHLHDAGLAVADILCTLDPADPLIVIDALRAGGQPGSVYRTRVENLHHSKAKLVGAMSLHELSVLPALQIETMCGRNFEDVTVFGIEPETIGWNPNLSARVATAIDKLVDAVAKYAVSLSQADKVAIGCGDTTQGDIPL